MEFLEKVQPLGLEKTLGAGWHGVMESEREFAVELATRAGNALAAHFRKEIITINIKTSLEANWWMLAAP